jgi:indolepyruvate ferredoxin oxidoreductase beta subunit
LNQEVQNILIAGVGGQGVLLASEILALAALFSGLEVKKSEVHGMAQRGGVVTSHVRYGKQVHSPLIPWGKAHMLLAFEEAEGLRWASILNSEGILIVNQQRILPPLVTLGMAEYPPDIPHLLSALKNRCLPVKAFSMAQGMGDLRLVNTIMLGAASSFLQLPLSSWNRSLKEKLRRSILDLNRAAFAQGRKLALGRRGGV